MHGDPERSVVRNLDLPVLLIELIQTRRWRHPGDARVVGSDAWTDPHQYHWRTIASTFSAFAEALGLTGRSTPGIVPA